jgi:MHS family metabolite:H+ symporter-like MFS transporter
VATGIGPVVAAALVVASGGSWWPIAIKVRVFSLCSLGAAIVMPETAGRDLTLSNDAHPGEAIIGPFARKERAKLGLPAPETVDA